MIIIISTSVRVSKAPDRLSLEVAVGLVPDGTGSWSRWSLNRAVAQALYMGWSSRAPPSREVREFDWLSRNDHNLIL